MTDFTEAQLKVLATATLLGREGIGFTLAPERVADRQTADSLVKSGHLAAVEGVDGGYRLSAELTAALALITTRQAEEAKSN